MNKQYWTTGNKLDDQAIAGEGKFTIWYKEPARDYVCSVECTGIRFARATYDNMVSMEYTMLNTRP